MKTLCDQAIWVLPIALIIALFYLLAPILTPFLLGALLAYLINPVVKRLESLYIPHLLSVMLVFLSFFIIILLIVLVLYPYAADQVEIFIARIPDTIYWLKESGMPWLMQYIDISSIKAILPATLSKTGWVVSTFLHSGAIAIQSLITFVLTPVVTFYLLRDWDKVMQYIKSLLPAKVAPTATRFAKDCDDVLSAFLRGQLLVMSCLALIYSVGLSLTGLTFGFTIGLIGGLLSIVPYLGSSFVLITAVIASYLQFGFNHHITAVIVIFLIGQGIEGYILTPYLIGERIGLHPVAIIFSVMTGGTLFGFFGVLLALPVAAVLMAAFMFMRQKQPIIA
jgi:predicted PurR-regulated permease PerM